MRPTTALRAEAKQIEKRLTSGKIKGPKSIERAKNRIHALRYHADRRDKNAVLKKSGARKPAKGHNPAQMQLPSFLGQMSVVKFEELVAKRVLKTLRSELEAELKKEKKSPKRKAA